MFFISEANNLDDIEKSVKKKYGSYSVFGSPIRKEKEMSMSERSE
jgi:predicted nucleotidyltransferase